MLSSYKSSLLVVPAILLAGLYINTNVFADSNDVDFSITVNPSLTLALSSNAVNFSITPTAQGAYNSANFTVTSATNNAYGYTLVMGTSNVNLTSSTINPVTTEYPTIPTLTETQDGISAATFEASTDSSVLNHYGVAIGTGNNFNAMKTTNPIKKTNANNASGVDTTTITLASKLDLATVPGTYSTTLNFQITANPLPGGLEEAYQNAGKSKKTINGKEYYAMQDMASTICSNVTVEDDQLQVYDNRDDKIYWIAKLKDGHCWMTQNLDLDLEATATNVEPLTSENTDLNTFGSNGYDTNNGYSQEDGVIIWEPERNTISTASIDPATGVISDWVSDVNNPYSVDVGDWYWTDTWYDSNDCTDSQYHDICDYLSNNTAGKFSQSQTGSGRHGHVGNYYNWTAAIASNDSSNYTSNTYSNISNNPQNSICPAGWRLPMISNASDTTGSTNEFKRLTTLYGNNTSNDKNFTATPLWLIRGGHILGTGSQGSSGKYGFYWTSTVLNGSYARNLGFTSSRVVPDDTHEKNLASSVRCIAR